MSKTEVDQDWHKKAYSFTIRIVEASLGDFFGTDTFSPEKEPQSFASKEMSLGGIVEYFSAPEGTQITTPNLVDAPLSIKFSIGDLSIGPDGLFHHGRLDFLEPEAVVERCFLNISEDQFQELCRKLPLYFLAFSGGTTFVWKLRAMALTYEPFPVVKSGNHRMWCFWFKHLAFYVSNRRMDL